MAEIKEISLSTIGEPYSLKIEKNSKGYNYEISVHESTMEGAMGTILKAKAELELQLYGSVPRHNPDAVPV